MNTLAGINSLVRKHLNRSGQTPTAFGLAVNKNPSLVSRLQKGNVTMGTIKAVEAYLAEHLSRPARRKAK